MALAGPGVVPAKAKAEDKARVANQMSSFLENKGQWDRQAKFLARSPGANVWVTAKGFVFDYYRQRNVGGQEGFEGHVVGMEFVGASVDPKAVGVGRTHTITDFIGSSTGRGVRSYQTVLATDVYPGVDVKSYFDGGKPRYDVIVGAGKDPSVVAFDIKGATGVQVDKKGDLVYSTSLGDRRQTGLFAYQVTNGKRSPVKVAYRMISKNRVGFSVGAYDRSRELVIDPLIYGSYYGGDGGHDDVRAAVTDERGGVYLTGATKASQFPAIYGPYGFSRKGGWDAFVAKFQDDAYSHDYAALIGGATDDVGMKLAVDQFGNLWVAGKTSSFDFPAPRVWKRYAIRQLSQGIAGSAWVLEIGVKGQTPHIRQKLPYLATSTTILDAIQRNSPALAQMVSDGTLVVTGDNPSKSSAGISIKFRVGYELPVSVSDFDPASPTGYRLLSQDVGLFLLRFKQSRETVLDPYENGLTQGYVVDADSSIQLVNMAIVPRETPNTNVPVRIVLAGQTSSPLEDIPGTQTSAGYLLTYDYINGKFIPVTDTTKYLPEAAADITGMVVDGQGSIYLSGTVFASGNSDTATAPNPVFQTTPGVFEGGRLSRNADLYARKYDRFGNVVYSCLIGGNSDEYSAGYWAKRTVVNGAREQEVIGNSIAVDNLGNAYVYGVTYSFNYPRTRGVYGETFNATDTQVVVTKLDPTASSLLYSTNLRTRGGHILPFGISVDQRGAVYLTGQVGLFSVFSWTGNPPDPVQPTGQTGLGIIPVTGDAIRGAFTSPANPNLHARDGYLMVLNPSATGLTYSSYVGGQLEDMVYAPYTNKFGDLWLTGWTQQSRFFRRVSSNGTPTDYNDNGGLAAGFITNLAFKASVDPVKRGTSGYAYGYDNIDVGLFPVSPVTINIDEAIDGYVLKFRLGLPIIQNFTINPTIIAGGDPRTTTNPAPPSTTATVTLDQAAPAGGINVRLSLNKPEVASFDPKNSVSEIDVFVAGGATTATARVYSRKVATRTSVEIKAEYEGNFRIVSLTVEPWLQKLSFTPATTAGGNTVTGRITLYQPVPADVYVSVTSEDPNDPIVQPGLIRVPSGQETVTFPVETKGVSTRTTVRLSASFLGAKQTTDLTLEPASLKELVLSPESTADFTTIQATLRLDGKAAATPVYAKVSVNAAGYEVLPKLADSPAGVVRIAAGASEVVFKIKVPFELAGIDRTVTAVRSDKAGTPVVPEQKVEATLLVTPVTVKSLTLSSSSVAGGHSVTGTVALSVAAPDSGVIVYLSANSGDAFVPAWVKINPGEQQATFTVKTRRVLKTTNVVLKASRSKEGTTPVDPNAKTAPLTITPITISSLVFAPTSIAGGSTTVGTVTLSDPAPAGGMKLFVTQAAVVSGNPVGLVLPTTVTVAEGATTANFTGTGRKLFRTVSTKVTLSRVSGDVPAGSDPNVVASTNVEVRAHLISSFVLVPNPVMGGEKSTATLTISEDAPVEGLTLYLSSNTTDATVPGSVVVAPGSRTVNFVVATKKVLADTNAVITASRVSGDLPAYADPLAKRSVTLRIVTHTITSLTFNPNPVVGGFRSVGTVSISAPAPAGGISVYLFSGNGMAAQVPTSVRVAAGATSATFNVTTSPVLNDTAVKIKASRSESGTGGSQIESVLTVKPVGVLTLAISPNPVQGGFSSKGTVTLSKAAPAGGITVYLYSNKAAASVPTSVVVAAGTSKASFTIPTTTVLADTDVTITASRSNTNPPSGTVDPSTIKTETLTVLAQKISGLTVVPNPVQGGSTAVGTVTISSPAPSAGMTIYLFSSNTAAATVPASVSIEAGQTQAQFVVTSKVVAMNLTSVITASRATSPTSTPITRSVTLTVLGVQLSSIYFDPDVVRGGNSTTLVITLSAPVPGSTVVTVNLSATNPELVNLPATATIQPGQSQVRVTVPTNTVARDLTTEVTATVNGSSQTTLLKVTR